MDTSASDDRAVTLDRLSMAALGALAGFATWALVDRFDGTRFALFLMAFVIGAFAVFFALSGPARRLHAALAAVALVLPAAGLLIWASLRYPRVEDYLGHPQGVSAFVAIIALGTPFAAAALKRRGGWRDYAALFDIAWIIVVRYGLGWVFTGIFWLLLFLSDALLGLVGIEVIGTIIDLDPVPYMLTGAVLGTALAVVHQFRASVSPFLLLRLLRLLLPPVLFVVIVFLIALPTRGLSDLFGGLSAAGTLMAVTAALLTLVTAVIDRDDEAAARSRFMLACARIAAALSPGLAVIALVAVLLRVEQYGWTPDRVTAGTAALVLVVYGLGYMGAVLIGRHWTRRLRGVNLWMALVAIGVSALWLTPVLHAERIATQSQIARYTAGLMPASDLPLYEMAHEWGRAGQYGLARLAAMEERAEHERLLAMIDRARNARYSEEYRRGIERQDRPEKLAQLAESLPVRPGDARIDTALLEGLDDYGLERWQQACNRSLPGGRPGCVLVRGEFFPNEADPEGIILMLEDTGDVTAQYVVFDSGQVRIRSLFDVTAHSWARLDRQDLLRVLDGDFAIGPAGVQALELGGRQIIPEN
ncbi:hypothetical protein [Pseudooceanicola sp.]|uniref:hypothetical protein n=1 Tax=Pseudooceanicola sp. TaxID=1914328 RepID=UPI0040588B7E